MTFGDLPSTQSEMNVERSNGAFRDDGLPTKLAMIKSPGLHSFTGNLKVTKELSATTGGILTLLKQNVFSI